ILKLGAAYVTIDPNNPPDRIRFILEDAQSRLLLTQQKNCDALLQSLPSNTQLLALDMLDYHTEKKSNLSEKIASIDLAYVIYTSGTTGLPKGVMITHHNVINYYE